MSEDQQQQQKKDPVQMPYTDLEATMMVTNPKWGDQFISSELKKKLTILVKKKIPAGSMVKNEKGEEFQLMRDENILEEQELWGLLNFYTRDMRLANLSKDELRYCQHFIDLAGDLLQDGKKTAFVISLSRAVTVLELSQSKGGFLRKRFGTFTREEHRVGDFGDKPNIIFKGKKKGGGY